VALAEINHSDACNNHSDACNGGTHANPITPTVNRQVDRPVEAIPVLTSGRQTPERPPCSSPLFLLKAAPAAVTATLQA
jgi:hypothetical protein